MDAPALTASAPVAPTPAPYIPPVASSGGSYKFIVVGILIFLIIIALVYYVYQHYSQNSAKKEGFVEGQRQERSDPGSDFDLQQSIKQLEIMQSKVLSELSNVH